MLGISHTHEGLGPVVDEPLWQRVLAPPTTRLGWWSIGLAAAFALLFAWFWTLRDSPRGGDTFFSNPWNTLRILVAGASAIGGGVTGLLAVWRKHECSIFLFAPVLVGTLVTLLVAVQLLALL